jgi:hypothetical protein
VEEWLSLQKQGLSAWQRIQRQQEGKLEGKGELSGPQLTRRLVRSLQGVELHL